MLAMPSPLTLLPIAPAHQDDAAGTLTSNKPKPPIQGGQANAPSYASSAVALSFAFDSATRSLNVVMTDKISGEIVRKIAYTHLPSDLHRADKLHGLLLDQFA